MLVLARRPLAPTLLPDVLGDQGRGSHTSHPSGETAQTPQIGQTTEDYGQAPPVRDHAHQAADADQVLLYYIFHHPLDGLYVTTAYVICRGRLSAER